MEELKSVEIEDDDQNVTFKDILNNANQGAQGDVRPTYSNF